VEIGDRVYELPPQLHLTEVPVELPAGGRTRLTVLSGSLIVDRIRHD
jgi:hypothetical protein